MVRRDYILNKVEELVCRSVNNILDNTGKKSVRADKDLLYSGTTNIPLAFRIARGICFCIFHERFMMSYAAISFRSGLSRRNIIRSVRKIKDTPPCDILVCSILSKVPQQINDLT